MGLTDKEINLGDLILVDGVKRFVKAINHLYVLVNWYQVPTRSSTVSFTLTEDDIKYFEGYKIHSDFQVDISQLKVGREYCWVLMRNVKLYNSLDFIIDSINDELSY